jgi:hypothetical protein
LLASSSPESSPHSFQTCMALLACCSCYLLNPLFAELPLRLVLLTCADSLCPNCSLDTSRLTSSQSSLPLFICPPSGVPEQVQHLVFGDQNPATQHTHSCLERCKQNMAACSKGKVKSRKGSRGLGASIRSCKHKGTGSSKGCVIS